MIICQLTFDIDPIGKGRAKSGNGHHYTPERTRVFEDTLKTLAREQYEAEPLEGPLKVDFFFALATKDKKRLGHYHTMKPDTTNLVKAVEDALNGVVWRDDCLLADEHPIKKWDKKGYIFLTVTQLEEGKTWEDVIATNEAQAKRTRELLKLQSKVGAEGNETITAEDYLRRAGRE